jgi:hypothetical protein
MINPIEKLLKKQVKASSFIGHALIHGAADVRIFAFGLLLESVEFPTDIVLIDNAGSGRIKAIAEVSYRTLKISLDLFKAVATDVFGEVAACDFLKLRHHRSAFYFHFKGCAHISGEAGFLGVGLLRVGGLAEEPIGGETGEDAGGCQGGNGAKLKKTRGDDHRGL